MGMFAGSHGFTVMDDTFVIIHLSLYENARRIQNKKGRSYLLERMQLRPHKKVSVSEIRIESTPYYLYQPTLYI